MQRNNVPLHLLIQHLTPSLFNIGKIHHH
jgi:hypothetical protein